MFEQKMQVSELISMEYFSANIMSKIHNKSA